MPPPMLTRDIGTTGRNENMIASAAHSLWILAEMLVLAVEMFRQRLCYSLGLCLSVIRVYYERFVVSVLLLTNRWRPA